MRHMSSTIAARVTGSANPNPNHRANPRRHKPRDPYRVAGQSAREALERLRVAERDARAEGRTVPPSCARVLLEIVGHLTTYSRRNDAFSVRRIEEGTGLARSTVRRALALLEGYGCIVRITPQNTPGQRTGSTIIALPIVEPDADDDPAEDDTDDDPGGWTSPRYRVGRDHLDDTPPGAPRRTRPLEHLDAPATRSRNEKEVRGEAKRDALPGQSPGGRPGGRPSPSLDGGPPQTDHLDTMTAEAAEAAGERMREALENGRGVDPADIRLVDRWAEHKRRAERGEVAA